MNEVMRSLNDLAQGVKPNELSQSANTIENMARQFCNDKNSN